MIVEDHIKLIGDPHLGKRFEVGVPAGRRGDREKQQRRKFVDALRTNDVKMIVMVGDLFDHPYVSYTVLFETIYVIKRIAWDRPNVQFVMMAGNHDQPQNLSSIGAWDIFDIALADRLPNLHVVRSPRVIDKVAFFPWQWGRPAAEQVEDIKEPFDVAIGHWDLASYGGDDSHLAPLALFPAHVRAYSGHYHTPGSYVISGRTLEGTGSLEPYSHSEDPNEQIYVTLSLEALRNKPEQWAMDKCLRVILQPGEELPVIDCFSIVPMRAPADEGDGGAGPTMSLNNFDWNGILAAKLAPLDPEVQTFIKERLPNGASQ